MFSGSYVMNIFSYIEYMDNSKLILNAYTSVKKKGSPTINKTSMSK